MGMGLVDSSEFNRQADKLSNKVNPIPSVVKTGVVPTQPVTRIPAPTGGSENNETLVPELVDTRELLRRSAGRGMGNVAVPLSLQQLIGETGALDSRQEAIQFANDFGISKSSASAYANGATSTTSYNQPSTPIKSHVEEVKKRISRKARGKLNLALEAITSEKLEHAKVKDISGVARDMAGVIRALEPSPESVANDGVKIPQVVIYAPSIVQENYFGQPLEITDYQE